MNCCKNHCMRVSLQIEQCTNEWVDNVIAATEQECL